MRLGLSLLNLRPGRIGGAETYVRKLLAELPRVAGRDDRLVAIVDRDVARALDTRGWETCVVPRSARRIVAERILEAFTPYRALAVERAFREVAADAVLFPQQSIFPKRAPCRAVLTVHDVQHLAVPGNVPIAERAFRAAIYPQALARAEHLIAISEYTRGAVLDGACLARGKITAIAQGFEPSHDAPLPTELVSGRFLYFPGATFAHKGHDLLVRAYAALRRRGALDCRLVFTGLRTRHWGRLSRLIAELGVARDVVHLGFLPYGEVRRVFAGAEAVVFPSRHEGFGLPVLEAVSLGKKVVTSRLPVFDEIGVPPASQIDFADPDQLAAALARPGPTVLLRTPATWAECAGRTLDVLREVAARPAVAAATRVRGDST